jgi:bifunctional DNA-binding transcriptional regulator/antitoxin component of YhaV-PrlF toxin-antitoxin module
MRTVQRVLSGRRISIPESYAKKHGVNEGDFIIVEENNGKLNIIPAEVKAKGQ